MTVDPNDYIISKKRKKYKFALFSNATNCYEFNDWTKKAVDVVEIGAGNGLFSVELAGRHPELSFVALDVKADRLQKGARQALDQGLSNISFIRARADQIDELFEAGTVKTIWLTFPDPFPRKGSAGRRLTHPTFLAKYRELLADNGILHFKHDNLTFFNWSLEQLVASGWNINELSFDLHASVMSDEYKILTTYEMKWLDEGLTTHYVSASC